MGKLDNPIKFEDVETTLSSAGLEGETQDAIIQRVKFAIMGINHHMKRFYREEAAGTLEDNHFISRYLHLLNLSPKKAEFKAALVEIINIRHDDPNIESLNSTPDSPFIALQRLFITARIIDAAKMQPTSYEIPVKPTIVFAPETENQFKTKEGEVIEFDTQRRESEPLSERELVGILCRAYSAGVYLKNGITSKAEVSLRAGEDKSTIVIPESFYARVEKKLDTATEKFLPIMKMAFVRGPSTTLETLMKTVMSYAIQRR